MSYPDIHLRRSLDAAANNSLSLSSRDNISTPRGSLFSPGRPRHDRRDHSCGPRTHASTRLLTFLIRIGITTHGLLHLAYLNILLLSVPSRPCFSQDLEDFRKDMQDARCDTTIREAWRKFTTALLDTWNRYMNDCVWIICASAVLARFQSYGSDVAIILSDICCCCCLVCIVLVWSMKRHLITIRDCRPGPEAPRDWHELTKRNATSLCFTTPMLLAAPISWWIWAYVIFGLTVVSLLWSAASGDMAIDVVDAALELNKSVSKLAHEVESLGLSAAATHNSPVVARVLVVIIILVGLCHVAFVGTHFSRLGYSLPHEIGCELTRRGERCTCAAVHEC